MSDILRSYGIPDEIVNAIMIQYHRTLALVRTEDGDSDLFEVNTGVLQCDCLASYLFVVCLDYALRQAVDAHAALGFTLEQRRSSRHQRTTLTDLDYADDIALLSDDMSSATELLNLVERETKIIGLELNKKKTEFMAFKQQGIVTTLDDVALKQVDDFQYLGTYIASTKRDINIRIAKAWSALSRMDVVWKSNLEKGLKIRFFQATIETVMLYGSDSWTLTDSLRRRLNGTYTRMLRAVFRVSWRQHLTNHQLYGTLPRVTDIIKERRTSFAGHCWRSKDEPVAGLLLWQPRHGVRSRGRPARTYIDQLEEDVGIRHMDLPSSMDDRECWRGRVRSVRASSIQ